MYASRLCVSVSQMPKHAEQSEWVLLQKTIGCKLFLPPFGISFTFTFFCPPASTWGGDWDIHQLTSFCSVETDTSLERWLEVLFISPRLCGPQKSVEGFSPLLLVSSAFFIPLSFLFLRTAFVPFLNFFLYIERNDLHENWEILLPFSFQYVCDLRSLKEKYIVEPGQYLPRIPVLRGQDSDFHNYNKIFEEWHADWNAYKQPVLNMKKNKNKKT